MTRLKAAIIIIIILASCQACVQIPPQRAKVLHTFTLFMPLTLNTPFALPIGVENEDFDNAADYYRGDFAKISIHWALVEPFPGYYDWHYADTKYFGEPVFLSLKGAPSWANGGLPVCNPPTAEYMGAMMDWMRAAIERYKPFAVEIGNEPDGTDFAPLYLGCFGSSYASGVEYAGFYNQVYSVLKAEFPRVQFLAGALLDVRNDFTAGMIDNLIAADGISFHVYEWCGVSYLTPSQINRLKALTALPLYLSETSLIYIEDSFICQMEQAQWYANLENETRLVFASWYNLIRDCERDWRNSTMLVSCGGDVTVKPVWMEYSK